MPRFRSRLLPLFGLLGCLAGVPRAHALLNLNDGRTRVDVHSNFTVGYDSNLFASAGGDGDTTYSWDLSMDATRRAGLIGVDASIGVNATKYGKYTGENFRNPRVRLDLSKDSGRTTGKLSLNASRESRADSAANLRNESWLYEATLAASNPILIGRYTVSGSVSYMLRDFADNTILSDQQVITLGTDLYYVLSDTRNLVLGYRVRQDSAGPADRNIDHSFTAGVNGRIIRGVNGMLRAGYVIRRPLSGSGSGSFASWTTSAAATWAMNRRFDLNAQVNKDFSTTSTSISVDSLTAGLNARYRLSVRTDYSAGIGWSSSEFLGAEGFGRRDTGWYWNAGVNRRFHRFLVAALNYSASLNQSTDAVSDFGRHSWTLSLISDL